jgi:NAD-dependent dihydropyrimidine dehydrogenase PreA subunit
MNHSNFEVHVNPDSCLGCGLCVKRCPMDALKLVVSSRANNKTGRVCTAQTEICIGCGLCAHKCKTESLILKRRECTEDPPANAVELKKRYAVEKAEKYAGEGLSMGSEDVYMGDISSGEAIE